MDSLSGGFPFDRSLHSLAQSTEIRELVAANGQKGGSVRRRASDLQRIAICGMEDIYADRREEGKHAGQQCVSC